MSQSHPPPSPHASVPPPNSAPTRASADASAPPAPNASATRPLSALSTPPSDAPISLSAFTSPPGETLTPTPSGPLNPARGKVLKPPPGRALKPLLSGAFAQQRSETLNRSPFGAFTPPAGDGSNATSAEVTDAPPSIHGFERVRLKLDLRLAELHRAGPVSQVRLPDGSSGRIASGWVEARRVLAGPEFSRARPVARTPGAHRRETFLTDMDPPDHGRIRRIPVPAFRRRRVQSLTPRVDALADSLLDAMIAAGPPAGLVLPLAITAIGGLLGVPARDRDRFQGWSDEFPSTTAFTSEQIGAAHVHLDDYLTELIAERRVAPSDDLLSELVRARDEDGALSEPELVNLGVGPLVAGYETTANQITNLACTLLTRRSLWDQLAVAPSLLPTAVDELLRFIPLGTEAGMPRVAVRDVELGGPLVRAGEVVYAGRPATNREGAAFRDPEQIVLDRTDNPHLAFGHGIHHCRGAHLARLEPRVALGALTARLPTARIAVAGTDLQWKAGLSVRGLRTLPLTWEDDTR